MVTLIRTKPCATVIEGVKLFPGNNLLSQAELDAMRNAKPRKGHEINVYTEEVNCGNMRLDEKVDTVVSDAVEKKNPLERAVSIVSEIADVNVSKAADIIAKINDTVVLKAVLEADSRTGVSRAAEQRINEIKAQAGGDTTPESIEAPEGDGSDFDDKLTDSKEAKSGNKGHTAVPALKKKSK